MGYEPNAIAARDAIKALVDELEEMISEEITLDSRVHARIIGGRGKGIRKIMEEFKVRGREGWAERRVKGEVEGLNLFFEFMNTLNTNRN